MPNTTLTLEEKLNIYKAQYTWLVEASTKQNSVQIDACIEDRKKDLISKMDRVINLEITGK